MKNKNKIIALAVAVIAGFFAALSLPESFANEVVSGTKGILRVLRNNVYYSSNVSEINLVGDGFEVTRTAGRLNVEVVGGGGGVSLPVSSTTSIVRDSVDSTKRMRFDVSDVGAGQTRVLSMPNADVDLAFCPAADEKDALAGTFGVPSALNPFVTDTDPRMTDSRAPTTHGSSHAVAGSDPLPASSVGSSQIVNESITSADVLDGGISRSNLGSEVLGAFVQPPDGGSPDANMLMVANNSSGSALRTTGVSITSTDRILGPNGSVAAPTWSYLNASNTGWLISLGTPNQHMMAIDGTTIMACSTLDCTFGVRYMGPLGNATAPALTTSTDGNTGVFFNGNDIIGLSTGGTERARVSNTGFGVGVAASNTLCIKTHSAFTNSEACRATGAVRTTDATQTTIASPLTMTVDNTSCSFNVTVTVDSSTTLTATYVLWARVKRYSGTASVVAQGALVTSEDDANLDATIDISANVVRVRGTGIAATTIDWTADIQYQCNTTNT